MLGYFDQLMGLFDTKYSMWLEVYNLSANSDLQSRFDQNIKWNIKTLQDQSKMTNKSFSHNGPTTAVKHYNLGYEQSTVIQTPVCLKSKVKSKPDFIFISLSCQLHIKLSYSSCDALCGNAILCAAHPWITNKSYIFFRLL